MLSAKIITALVAVGARLVSAQSGSLCSQPTVTIAAAADATIDCTTISGDIVFDSALSGTVDISGPRTVKGDVIVNNVTQLISLSSDSIAAIQGTFKMQGLTLLSTLNFPQLQSVNTISWITLPALNSLSFGTVGVTKVSTIEISDTALNSLDGLNVVTVANFTIDNNKQLVTYTSGLTNVTSLLSVSSNGFNFQFSAPSLTTVKDVVVQNAASVDMPALKNVGGSIKFDSNGFQTFIAPNVSSTTLDVSFINNAALTNLSFPALTKTGGALTIANNTALTSIDGFPKLSSVGGAVSLRGNFSDVFLPALNDVKGAFTLLSTQNIDNTCKTFEKHQKQGGDGRFQGTFQCKGNDENANEGGNSSNNSSENAAPCLGYNLPVVLGMAVLGGLAQI